MRITAEQIRKMADGAQTEEFIEALWKQGFGDGPNKGDVELSELAYEVRRRRERLVGEATSLRNTMQTTLNRLERQVAVNGEDIYYSGSINSIGEVQGSGSSVDVACALYNEACNRLSAAIYRRVEDEKRDAKRAAFAKLFGESRRAIDVVLFVRRQGDSTVINIASGLKIEREKVEDVVAHLLSIGALTCVGKRHYCATNDVVEYFKSKEEKAAEFATK